MNAAEQIGRERNQRASDRQLARDAVVSRRVASIVIRLLRRNGGQWILMNIAHRELITFKSKLTDSEILAYDLILDYNEIIQNAQSRTGTNLLHLLISEADVIPTSGEFHGTRTTPPRFPIKRTRLVEKLDQALLYLERHRIS